MVANIVSKVAYVPSTVGKLESAHVAGEPDLGHSNFHDDTSAGCRARLRHERRGPARQLCAHAHRPPFLKLGQDMGQRV